MSYPIRVHTLTLPFDDWIASYILTNPQYVILINERQTTKTGDVIMHLEYEDHMGLGYDYYSFLIKSQTNEEKVDILNALEETLSNENVVDDNYVPEELKVETQPKKTTRRKK